MSLHHLFSRLALTDLRGRVALRPQIPTSESLSWCNALYEPFFSFFLKTLLSEATSGSEPRDNNLERIHQDFGREPGTANRRPGTAKF